MHFLDIYRETYIWWTPFHSSAFGGWFSTYLKQSLNIPLGKMKDAD